MTLPPNPEHPEQPDNGSQQDPQGPAAPQPAVPQAPQAPQAESGQPTAPQPPAYTPPQPQFAPPAPPAPPAPQAPAYATPQTPPQYGAPQAPGYGAQYQQRHSAPQFASAYGVDPGPGGPYDGATHPDDMTRPLYGASFGQAIKRFFKGYAKFNGRASRSEYWWVALFSFLVSLVPAILLVVGLFGLMSSAYSYDYDAYGSGSYSADPPAGSIALLIIGGGLNLLIGLGLLLPSFAIGWRRLHDGNFAGPLYLLVLGSMIPFVNYIGWIGGIVVIVLTIMPSKAEGRRFDVS